MLRRYSFAFLAALAASSGCSLCQNCDYYGGSYYGGRVGGSDSHGGGRAGSVYASTSYEQGVPYEAAAQQDE